tara:strand:+ start:2110 stop:2655 length:546 start_codon:yes stop_codon:yes gene_type:complete
MDEIGSHFRENKRKYIAILLLLLFGILWIYLGDLYSDNYSIEKLIREYGLYGGDTLSYEIIINQGLDSKECKIKGDYENDVLNIQSVKDTKYRKGNTNSVNCNYFKNNTDNFKFIATFDEWDGPPSEYPGVSEGKTWEEDYDKWSKKSYGRQPRDENPKYPIISKYLKGEFEYFDENIPQI